MMLIPGSVRALPAVSAPHRATSAANAWLGPYQTIQLTAPIRALRVHVGAGAAASTVRLLAVGAGLHGRWFAVGDVVQTYDQYRASRALPGHFTDVALATLLAGAILNVGRCSPLFGQPGGGEQIEFVDGPAPIIEPLPVTWSRQAGHA
jgi:hypothetical protein